MKVEKQAARQKEGVGMREKIRSAVLGAAIGDALGVPVEFASRGELEANPVIGMIGFGTYHMPEGTWSDDTSMTLATMHSLLSGVDEEDLMKHFTEWLFDGSYTPYGQAIGVGNTTRQAILQYQKGKNPKECGGAQKNDNGNGSLMRILPVVLYGCAVYGFDVKEEEILPLVHRIAGLTHRHVRSQIACGIYTMIVLTLLKEGNLSYSISHGMERAFRYYEQNKALVEEVRFFDRIRKESFRDLKKEEIQSTGYVLDTLEAVLWCLLNSKSYKECVLKAVNLGGDTDTIASIAGGIAGIAYGMAGIPEEWTRELKCGEYIEELCAAFSEVAYQKSLLRLLPFESFLEIATKRSCYTGESLEKEKARYVFAYPEYTAQVNEFIHTVENSYFWSYHYIAVLNAHGLDVTEGLKTAIDTADVSLLSAILTAYIRQERFEEGLIATAIEEKIFLHILQCLQKQLIP